QEEPEIDCDYDGTDFTCITFTPDWKRFHMTGMEADTIALLRKVSRELSDGRDFVGVAVLCFALARRGGSCCSGF
ncbi:unnamed protein product, partial [Scytosiphon promiscuus]